MHENDNHFFPHLKQWLDNLKTENVSKKQTKKTLFLSNVKKKTAWAGICFSFFVLIMSKVVKQMSRKGKINMLFTILKKINSDDVCDSFFFFNQKHFQQQEFLSSAKCTVSWSFLAGVMQPSTFSHSEISMKRSLVFFLFEPRGCWGEKAPQPPGASCSLRPEFVFSLPTRLLTVS